MDGSRIRNKTVSFSFENGVVWTGSKFGNGPSLGLHIRLGLPDFSAILE